MLLQMKKNVALMLAALFLLSQTWAAATEDVDLTGKTNSDKVPAEVEPAPGPQSTTSAGSPEKAQTRNKTGNKKTGDIFQPSEEISEDFAVSFPVDI
jgi:hypothetical protein